MGFDGKTLSYGYEYYTSDKIKGPYSSPPQLLPIKDGAVIGNLLVTGFKMFDLTVYDTAIHFDFQNTGFWKTGVKTGKTTEPFLFNGVVFADSSKSIPSIIGVTLKTNIAAVDARDVVFTEDSIQIDFQGATTRDTSSLLLTVFFRQSAKGAIVFQAKAESVFVRGQEAGDRLTGGRLNDMLEGGGGNDVIDGMAGNDVIYAGLGMDDLFGRTGSDVFVFKSIRELGTNPTRTDTIFDMQKGDKIDFSAIDANTKAARDQDFTFIGTKAFSGKAGELSYKKLASDTYIYGDVNGDKKADFALHLDDRLILTADYFLL